MIECLGIDTSNYTTSVALWNSADGVRQQKKLLPVKPGTLGLRQSDAVFHHTQQLPEILEKLLSIPHGKIGAVGVSSRPRAVDGSYMPCFTVGEGVGRALAAALNVPLFRWSHQQGHIAAALYSSGRLDLIGKEFYAFHVSGGTTEALHVLPDPEIPMELAAHSLDLKAGQAIDRVGGLLGLPFPAGPQLEKLAQQSKKDFKVHVPMKGCDCSLSGVENQCQKMLREGVEKEDIAKYCLSFILEALCNMTEALLKERPGLPLVFAGGVMSNAFLKEGISKKYQAFFAEPVFSADNAAGIAVLTALREGML
ncbi:MAG: peptidase M22 [Clostridiales bacterium]|jgi:N6-L-threonylcarbamoyladenine synthase|nr:peptidase M22 [Clostridiales bacterium]MCI2021169.1 peptidase M22 [Clostridiales bacterium]MCI2025552.1 peptidase M22 [Clostridiales bacterium]MCI2160484.1 peptidase M22 [Oscillospiraceae bacterium]MCI2192118.1 peptidase M22 [Oscillospiraceae bacterium]